MSVAGFASGFTRRRLLATVVILMIVGGAGVGIVSNTLLDQQPPVTPPGSSGASAPDASISVSVSDPTDVRNADGDVGPVRDGLSGSLTVDGEPDRVELLIHSRTPNGTWVTVDRATWRSDSSAELDVTALVGGENVTFLDASQSDGFDVAQPGTFERRTGAVSITARIQYDDRVTSVTDGDSYEFTVEHLADETTTLSETNEVIGFGSSDADTTGDTPEDGTTADTTEDDTNTNEAETSTGGGGGGAGSGGAGGGDGGEDEQIVARTSALLGASNIMPGAAAEESATVSNTFDEPADLDVTVGPAIDEENGLAEPEREVDDTPDEGELSEHIEMRMFVERNGVRQYVVGGGGEFVTLANAAGSGQSVSLAPDEAVSLVVQWRLDSSVGNVVQSDSVTLSIHLTLIQS